MEREKRLIGLYTRVYSRPINVSLLKILGFLSVFYVVACYATVLAGLAVGGEYRELLLLLAVSGIPFLVISLVRHILNVQRPYEIIDFAPFEKMREKRKTGRSFPSRHVFSAFLIGTLVIAYSASLGTVALFVGTLIAIERVLLGIHFPKDVIVGGILGIISGVIGLLFL